MIKLIVDTNEKHKKMQTIYQIDECPIYYCYFSKYWESPMELDEWRIGMIIHTDESFLEENVTRIITVDEFIDNGDEEFIEALFEAEKFDLLN